MVANTVCDDSLDDKKRRIVKIKTLFAFDLFCQGNKFKVTRMYNVFNIYIVRSGGLDSAGLEERANVVVHHIIYYICFFICTILYLITLNQIKIISDSVFSASRSYQGEIDVVSIRIICIIWIGTLYTISYINCI